MDLKLKKLYSADNYPLFNMITISSKAIFLLIDSEFVDACGIPHQVLLFDGLPLCGSSLKFVCPPPPWISVPIGLQLLDFVITFWMPYSMHILAWISIAEIFSSVKIRITLITHFIARSWTQLSVSLPSLFFSSRHNF